MTERRDDDELSGTLERATRLLRAEPVPRAEWRQALLRSVASAAPRRWSVRPAVAIAACAVCMIAGAAVVYGLRDRIGGSGTVAMADDGTGRQPRLPVRFAVKAPGAARVSIVGDFNGWNPSGLPLHLMSDGRTWEVEVGLPPGRYAYAFVVDGRLARDSSAAESGADDFGVPNSVVLVGGS